MSEKPFINILIAEDNDVSREMMAGIVRAQGYNVIGAIDASSAIKVITEHAIDLALVDLHMAPKGGFDFMKYLLVNNIDLPVIMVTADDSSDLLLQANDLGVKQILHKPINPERLIKLIYRLLKAKGINPNPVAVNSHTAAFTPEQLMQHAIDLADTNAKSKRGGPFGAIVADREGHVLGEGKNGITSRVDPTAHAEVMAIRQAAERLGRADLSDCVLYCTSEPTMMGKSLIISVGIGQVYYGLTHQDIKSIRASEERVRQELAGKGQTQTVYKQLGHDAAMKMFRHWEAQKDKVSD
ncbi:MAG TPA: response regulator [Rhodospirillaceae bacterium]|nr:response regulator [Rhodospirillaceae bacterium]